MTTLDLFTNVKFVLGHPDGCDTKEMVVNRKTGVTPNQKQKGPNHLLGNQSQLNLPSLLFPSLSLPFPSFPFLSFPAGTMPKSMSRTTTQSRGCNKPQIVAVRSSRRIATQKRVADRAVSVRSPIMTRLRARTQAVLQSQPDSDSDSSSDDEVAVPPTADTDEVSDTTDDETEERMCRTDGSELGPFDTIRDAYRNTGANVLLPTSNIPRARHDTSMDDLPMLSPTTTERMVGYATLVALLQAFFPYFWAVAAVQDHHWHLPSRYGDASNRSMLKKMYFDIIDGVAAVSMARGDPIHLMLVGVAEMVRQHDTSVDTPAGGIDMGASMANFFASYVVRDSVQPLIMPVVSQAHTFVAARMVAHRLSSPPLGDGESLVFAPIQPKYDFPNHDTDAVMRDAAQYAYKLRNEFVMLLTSVLVSSGCDQLVVSVPDHVPPMAGLAESPFETVIEPFYMSTRPRRAVVRALKPHERVDILMGHLAECMLVVTHQ